LISSTSLILLIIYETRLNTLKQDSKKFGFYELIKNLYFKLVVLAIVKLTLGEIEATSN